MVPPPGSRLRLRIHVLVLVLAAAAAAGCLGGDDARSEAVGPASFEEARASDGVELGTTQGPTRATVELLVPASLDVDRPGEQPVVVLVHDKARGEPVTEADVSLEARMPAMGHGTGPEQDPQHAGEGIYEGRTTWAMAGEWVLTLEVELPDGSSGAFDVDVRVGEHDVVAQDVAQDPFPSFAEAMSAPGTVYEGELVAPANDTATHHIEVVGPYQETFDLVTEDRHLERVQLRGELDPGTPADALNLTLHDPEGTVVATVVLDQGTPTGEATIDDPAPGAWTVEVRGQALRAPLDVELEATYEAPHVDVKTLDPIDPTRAVTGDRPFLFLVFDAVASAPVTDAEVSYAVWQGAGGGDAATARHEGAGQHAPASGFAEQGAWNVRIDVELPTGEAYRFPIEAQAYPPGEVPEGSAGGSGHGHDH